MSRLFKYFAHIYVILFFIGQNNFLLTNFLAVNKGLEIGKYRASILIIFLLVGFFIFILRFWADRTMLDVKFSGNDVFLICLTLFLICVHIISDVTRLGSLDFIGIAPLIEGIFFAVFFNVNVRGEIRVKPKILYTLTFFIFLNLFLEILFYLRDLSAGLSYGAFRANIAGIVVNRNPSFFYPIFAYLILRFVTLSSWVRVLCYVIFIIFILTIFYRTIYVALLVPIFIDTMRFGLKVSLKTVVRLSIIVVFIVIGVFIADSKFESEFNFSILDAFTGRFTSTFTDYSDDEAQSGRIEQLPVLFKYLFFYPFGMGFSGLIDGAEIYNYAFYFLHPILYLGLPFILVYIVLFRRILKIYERGAFCLKNRVLFLSIVYFSMTLVFFPYMNYFTFTSVFIFLIQLSSVEVKLDLESTQIR